MILGRMNCLTGNREPKDSNADLPQESKELACPRVLPKAALANLVRVKEDLCIAHHEVLLGLEIFLPSTAEFVAG